MVYNDKKYNGTIANEEFAKALKDSDISLEITGMKYRRAPDEVRKCFRSDYLMYPFVMWDEKALASWYCVLKSYIHCVSCDGWYPEQDMESTRENRHGYSNGIFGSILGDDSSIGSSPVGNLCRFCRGVLPIQSDRRLSCSRDEILASWNADSSMNEVMSIYLRNRKLFEEDRGACRTRDPSELQFASRDAIVRVCRDMVSARETARFLERCNRHDPINSQAAILNTLVDEYRDLLVFLMRPEKTTIYWMVRGGELGNDVAVWLQLDKHWIGVGDDDD